MGRVSPVWHPMTQHKTFGAALPVESAYGETLKLQNGREILDGISSWWVNTHGHCHPKIVKAVQDQAAKLEQVIFCRLYACTGGKADTKIIEHRARLF